MITKLKQPGVTSVDHGRIAFYQVLPIVSSSQLMCAICRYYFLRSKHFNKENSHLIQLLMLADSKKRESAWSYCSPSRRVTPGLNCTANFYYFFAFCGSSPIW